MEVLLTFAERLRRIIWSMTEEGKAQSEEEQEKIERRIHKLADAGYVVIYITETAAQKAKAVIDEYAAATFPAIILIPSGNKSLGLGMQRVRENVEKAVGADILFKEG